MRGSEISFFQRYSQQENHVTNNTVLLLRHICQTSPFKLQRILGELVESEAVVVGPSFRQQERGRKSVPDASISQTGWSIIIETKLTPHLDEDQMARHFEGACPKNGETVFVIGLTTTRPDKLLARKLADVARVHGVTFVWRSFLEFRDIVDAGYEPHETALREVVTDYIDFLDAADLIDAPHDRIYVVPCGDSYDDNRRFGLYYHPASRSYRPFKYLGIYKNRCVSLIGEVGAIVVCNYEDGRLDAEVESGVLTEAHKGRIREAIEQTRYYDLSRDTRFFMTDGFADTKIDKSTARGIWGPRYLSISELVNDSVATGAKLADVAQALSGSHFA